jgi:hypothetical protein
MEKTEAEMAISQNAYQGERADLERTFPSLWGLIIIADRQVDG